MRTVGSHSHNAPENRAISPFGLCLDGTWLLYFREKERVFDWSRYSAGTRNGRFMHPRHSRTISGVAASHRHLKRPGLEGQRSCSRQRQCCAQSRGLLRYLIGWHAEARPPGRTYNATANSANATASRLFAGSSTANS
jgi:hypothetical protein